MKTQSKVLFALPMFSALYLGGCVVESEEPPPPGVVVEGSYDPGYYYDAEYYDAANVFHPQAFWYFDGHSWEHRDRIPAGVQARERHVRGEVHRQEHR